MMKQRRLYRWPCNCVLITAKLILIGAKYGLSRNNQEKALECFRNACMKADLDNAEGFKIYAKVALSMKKGEDALIACKKLA